MSYSAWSIRSACDSVLTKGFLKELELELDVRIASCIPVSGGDINDAYRLVSESGNLFIKTQNRAQGLQMLQAEKIGLEALTATNTIRVPQPMLCGTYRGVAYLVMQHLKEQKPTNKDWINMGVKLAALHQFPVDDFGFSTDNFIGTLPQLNSPSVDWSEFYADQRIEPLMQAAGSLLTPIDRSNWHILRSRLPEIIPCDRPSLIHGDLWGGNVMHTDSGPTIYDPAVCRADREMDLAMARLFGGFPSVFFDAYSDVWAVQNEGAKERSDIYQLYYLLAHVVMFGQSYSRAVRHILERYA